MRVVRVVLDAARGAAGPVDGRNRNMVIFRFIPLWVIWQWEVRLVDERDPDHAESFRGRVLADTRVEARGEIRTLRDDDTIAVLVVAPTVIPALEQTVVENLAERQLSASVRAQIVESNDVTLHPHYHDIPAAEREPNRRVHQVCSIGDRMPEVAKRAIDPSLGLDVEFVSPRDMHFGAHELPSFGGHRAKFTRMRSA